MDDTTGTDPDLSWVGVLEHHARRAPDRALAVFGGETSPTARWPGVPRRSRPGCSARGVGAGDVVGLLSYNCTEFLETIFAANHLGAIAMPVNWRLAAPELRYILDHSEARALVCDDELVALADEATADMERDLAARVHRDRAHRTAGPRSPICGRTTPSPASAWRPTPCTA